MSDMVYLLAEGGEKMTDREILELLVQGLTELKVDVKELKTDVASLKTDVEELKTDVANLKDESNDLRMHIENVTDRNICMVAEGHLDVMRKLNDTLSMKEEKNLLLIHMSYLESELSKVKRRLAELEQTA